MQDEWKNHAPVLFLARGVKYVKECDLFINNALLAAII
jgi:hypothetical protein